MRGISVLVALALAMAVGLLSVVSSKALIAALACLMLIAAAVAVWSWRGSMRGTRPARRFSRPRLLAASALVCYMISTLSFRARSGSAIAANPVDSAGFIRVALLAGAFVLALAAIVACWEAGLRATRLALPARLYLLYIALALAAVPVAVQPGYSLFAVADLTVLVVTFLAAARAFRGDEVSIFRVILGFQAFLVGTVAVGIIVAPARTLVAQSGTSFPRLAGAFPSLTFNTLGTFGVLFFAAGLAGQKPRRTLIISGLVLVVLTQYRTGIIASLVVFAIYLLAQRKVSRRAFAFLLVLGVFFVTQTAEFQHLWLRGSSAQVVGSLSGRETYWSAALKAVQESPVVGLGIKSGTRFEVLVSPADAYTSSLHNTWIEALVGVGVLGLAALLAAFLLAVARAVKRMHTPEGLLALLLLASIGVRSLTGTTIELAGLTPLVFLAAVSVCESAARRRGVANADRRPAPLRPELA